MASLKQLSKSDTNFKDNYISFNEFEIIFVPSVIPLNCKSWLSNNVYAENDCIGITNDKEKQQQQNEQPKEPQSFFLFSIFHHQQRQQHQQKQKQQRLHHFLMN
jgi:hypothetical protein